MYQTTKDLDVVKRFGRWNSDAFHGYLWESHERQKDLAKGRAGADGQLLAPRKNKGYEAEHRSHDGPKLQTVSAPMKPSSTSRVGASASEDEIGALGGFDDEEHEAHGHIILNEEAVRAKKLYGKIESGMDARPKGLRSTDSDFSSTAKCAPSFFSVREKF